MECLKFSGDFFGNRDIRELELLLRGKRHQENSLMEALNSIDLEDYIHGVSAKEIIGRLFYYMKGFKTIIMDCGGNYI